MNKLTEAIQIRQWRWSGRHVMYVWLALMLLLPLPITTAQAAEPVVVGDGTPASCTHEAFQQAIASAPADSTITFNCGPDPVTIWTGAIRLYKNLTIDGGGLITLMDPGSGWMFEINDAVQFENFTIIGGSMGERSPIFIYGMLTMRNVTVTHHVSGRYSGYEGGGIFNLGTLTIEDSVIAGNATLCIQYLYGDYYRCGNGDGGGGIANYGVLHIRNSIISNNTTFASGGGILNYGTAVIENTTISGNASRCQEVLYPGGPQWTCGDGGGILNSGTLTLINSTISGNSTSGGDIYGGNGGGIANNGRLFLQNTTITDNIAQYAGGLASYYQPVNLQNSLLANNLDLSNLPSDCSGTLTSQGYNLIGSTYGCTITGDTTGNVFDVDPLLGPLQNNGGLTLTHMLLPGSPAIDAGNPAAPGSGGTACEATDQRGVARPQDGDGDGLSRCDIGAVEVEPSYLVVTLDIRPGSGDNPINVKSKGVIPVAILWISTFDATTVDPSSVSFGPSGAKSVRSGLEDVNGDGHLDLVLHFRTQQTGLTAGDTQACLTGKTQSETLIQGCDSIRIVP